MLVDFRDLYEIKEVLRRRREARVARFDEVWDGVYVIGPVRDNEHQNILAGLVHAILDSSGGRERATVCLGVCVSDRRVRWRRNYRLPDISVFLPGNPAEDCKTHYYGGPDLAIEVMTAGDRTREKIEFYARIGVRELLLIDRDPWRLELWKREDGRLAPVAIRDVDNTTPITSRVVSLDVRLVLSDRRPKVEVTNPADGHAWLA